MESRPRELIVEERPRKTLALVGDDWLERPFGACNAVIVDLCGPCLLSAPSRFALGVVALWDEVGRGVMATLKDDDDIVRAGLLFFCGRCDSGNKASGGFFILLSRNIEDVDVFFGVVFGLDKKALSIELASDREDSD